MRFIGFFLLLQGIVFAFTPAFSPEVVLSGARWLIDGKRRILALPARAGS